MPIIFLHGFLGHPKDWDAVRSHLQCESIALTLPGHLNEPMTEDIVRTVHEKLGGGLLVGYSAGGRLALALKARFPLHYTQVIALSAHPGISDTKEREKRRQQDATWIEMLRNEPLKSFLQKWYAQPLFEGLSVNMDHRIQHDPLKLALFLERFGTGNVRSPKLYPETIFACGDRDLKYKALYHKIPHIIIPASGHAIHLENPQACARLIKEKIDENKLATRT